MSGLFSHPSPTPVVSQSAPGLPGVTPTTPPGPGNASVQNAGAAAASTLGSSYGEQSTILTSGLGAPGQPRVAKKFLLGQ